MHILFVTPTRAERFSVADADKKITALVSALNRLPDLSAEVLDLGGISLEENRWKTVAMAVEKERNRFAQAEIVHSWSAVALFLRPLFPGLIAVTVREGDPFLASFLPHEGEPGVAVIASEECVDPERLGKRYRLLFENNRSRDSRPWGYWESLRLTDTHKVKHIFVAPGEKLSLQYHNRRREVWTVVEGRGIITVGDEALEAVPGKVFVIERGVKHRAEGGPAGLHFIEVQSGDYLGEDDIVRLEDCYGRVK